MNQFLNRFRQSMSRFMYGRYGNDELSRFLSLVGIALLVLSLVPGLRFVYFLALALVGWACFRSFSRNTQKRWAERNFYMNKKQAMVSWINLQKKRWTDRKTHAYYRCPSCKKALRVPRGKGKIRITCPQCHNSFSRKT